MSFWSILDTIFLGPLKMIFEVIFNIAYELTGNVGLSIVLLSLAMNILVLPLYMCADRMQDEARVMEAKLHGGISHIKKTFKGDERMMMLQTYYKQNHYSPLSALNGSVSLLLEIPFFMAAYQFLSNATILSGVSLGPIADLASADAMIKIGGFAINVLPILMTVINIVASVLYLKGAPLKSKIQLYAMAVFFLVFLYTSPSGLVFYWTLNNVFSLVKTIFYKLKNPKKVLRIFSSVVGGGLVLLVFAFNYGSTKLKIVTVVVAALLQLPILIPIIKEKLIPAIKNKLNLKDKEKKEVLPNRKLFTLGCLFMVVLVGVLIPSAYIAASPQEYINIYLFNNPLKYVLISSCMAVGVFLVWLQVFYWLANKKARVVFDKTIWILSLVMLVDYMFFGTNLGIMTSGLQYETGFVFTALEQVLNVLVIVVMSIALYFVVTKWKKLASMALVVLIVAIGGMSGLNIGKITKSINDINADALGKNEATFGLSKKGQNVIVIMLDRAMGLYVPYIMKEKPELKEKFAGFTYYSNTISFSGSTNMAAPALLGGYEYTPVEINKRDTESLKDKNNEANLMLPVLFDNAGFDVTVSDPIYMNYQWISDLSVFDEYEDIKAFNAIGRFMSTEQIKAEYENNNKNFFRFSLMKTMPLLMQSVLYDGGKYNNIETIETKTTYSNQTDTDPSKATGIYNTFMQNYLTMVNLSGMTKIVENDTNTYFFMRNDMTHSPQILEAPSYTPAWEVDNTQYDKDNVETRTINGVTLKLNNYRQASHYHANMAAFIQLANWFDYLRANDVYDNTRIILVSDHGVSGAWHTNDLVYEGRMDFASYAPLLMVKDFNSESYTTSSEFMTNADVPTLAVAGLIENAKNPFTNKPINNAEKTAHPQYILRSDKWDVAVNKGNTFIAGPWVEVKGDNIYDMDNWSLYSDNVVLKSHSFPN